jgi:hypothetical protein
VANTLNPLIPKLLGRGLLALRQEARMARLVNRGFEQTPGAKGSTVTIGVPAAVAVNDVTPANTPPATNDTTIGEVSIAVDQWKEAAFHLSDKDMTQIDAQENYLPMQASEAIKALANTIDNAIWALYKDIGGFAGTAGTTPFATDAAEYLAARKVLNNQLAPMDPRYAVINADAEANALGLRAFQDASFSGSIDGIVNGQINNKLGARWAMSQNVPNHTAGTITTGLAAKSATVVAAGATSFVATTAASTGACALVQGDVIHIAGHTKTYALASAATQGSASTDVTVTITEGLERALAGGEAVTVEGNHAVNMVFHPNAFALVTRPFQNVDPLNLGTFLSAVDPVSGLTLRIEVTREHKRTRWAYDVLYGVKTVRAALASRLAG